jgi:SAM-dependent methyltransferase
MIAADVRAFARANLPAAPARVLEVGAGDGALARSLRTAGYDVVAIDPDARGEGVDAVSLHELEAPIASHDAAIAVVSLHHVSPLEASCARLGEVLRPGAPLLVDELDVDRYDVRAMEWWLAQQRARGAERDQDAETILHMMRGHLHPLARIGDALRDAGFAVGEPVRGPYLYRWELNEALRAVEEDLIARGALPAVGARLVAIRA